MRGTAMPAPQGSFIPNALLILGLSQRIVKRARVVLVVGLLAGLALPLAAQVPLCVLELWTDSSVYSLGQTVSVFARLQVGEEPITGARFKVETRAPGDRAFTVSTSGELSGELNLQPNFRWEGFLLNLPSRTGQGLLALTGFYTIIGTLFDPPSGQVYCEDRKEFAIQSPWGQKPTTKTLLVSSQRTEFTEPFVSKLAAWLEAAYKTRVQTVYQEGLYLGYRKGDYKDYDVIVYYGIDYQQPPPLDFLDDIANGEEITKKRVVWIGYHLDRLGEAQKNLGFQFAEQVSDPRETRLVYTYSNTDYIMRHTERSFVEITDRNLARVHATVGGRPIIVSSKHRTSPENGEYFYFVGFHPTAYVMTAGAHLVFLDILNEVYGINRGKIALVRLEDIHPRSSISALLSVTDYLKSEKVPFTLSLIPFYVDGADRTSITQESAFRTAVKQALLNGGELVVHGASHQFDGKTAEDWEFWDEKTDKPIGGAEYAEQRVKLALTEIQKAGLAPHTIGWETPHYKASEAHYAVFEKYFGFLFEPHRQFELAFVPYVIETTSSVYIGTPLGFVQNDVDISRITLEAEKLAGLKYGAIAAFFYHPFLGVDRLRALVTTLKKQGWQFQLASRLIGPIRVQFPEKP
uniref:Hypothetical conserved protein n=2 Tax=Candidatus Bipolaricaulota TaxID=67810 RepID=H5SN08_9BACT|nr:hypothetical conserved protein [uncultured Acetothermia bacterium]BAL58985.1 hypothetical conserved protein [Candidatus Acetothermum autotrophicum]